MKILYCLFGILIPFFGTCIGSCITLFLKKNISKIFYNCLLGFAVGVMLAASIWSLIIPSINMVESTYKVIWFPAVIGLIAGVLFLIFISDYCDKLFRKNMGNINLLFLSITLHNIPEGMAVGVCFAGVLSGNPGMSLFGAMILSIGIAIQNIPEGAIVSMPISSNKNSKIQSFFLGVLSGVAELIAAFLTIILVNIVIPVLPYLLSFSAGAMIYVVVEELILEMHIDGKSSLGMISLVIGFSIMMVLDVVLG